MQHLLPKMLVYEQRYTAQGTFYATDLIVTFAEVHSLLIQRPSHLCSHQHLTPLVGFEISSNIHALKVIVSWMSEGFVLRLL